MKKERYFHLLWLLISFTTNAQHYKIHHYTAERGLPNVLTKCIWKDEIGFVWIGSDAGVFRFDGKLFESYFHHLASPYVKSFQKIDEKLVVVHDEGVNIITNQIDSVFFTLLIRGTSTITDTTANYPKNAFQDRLGRIWINEPQSVVRLENGKVKRYNFGEKHRTNSFLRSFNFADFNEEMFVLVSQQGGIFVYNYRQDRFDTLKTTEKITNINTIARISKSVLWIGSSEGILEMKYDKKKFTLKKIPSPLGISVLKKGYNGEVLIGTWNSGLYWAKPSAMQHIVPIKLGESIVVNDIFIEKNGDAWISTDNGFFHLKTTFFGKVQLPYRRGYIQCLAQLNDTYFASDGAIAYRMSVADNTITTQPLFEEIYEEKNGDLLAIAPTPHHIWLGNSSGNILKWESKTSIKKLNLLHIGGTIYHIVADKETNAWACQYDLNGILCVKPDMSYKVYNQQQGLNTRVYAIRLLNDGNLYAGGEGSVFYKYNTSKDFFESFPLKVATHEEIFVNDFFMDKEKRLWIGSNIGLLVWQNGQTEKVDFGEKVAVKSITISENGTAWIGTDNGVVKYAQGKSLLYDEMSGLPSKTCSYRGIMADSYERIWVATSFGVACSSVSDTQIAPTPTPILLHLTVNHAPYRIPPTPQVHLPYQSTINLRFASLVYPADKILYQYRVTGGIQDDWSAWSEKNEIMLPRLVGGDYQLQVRALMKSGYTTSQTLLFHIRIDKAWYQTTWAYLLFGTIFIGLVFGIAKIYAQHLVAEKARLEKIVEDRTAEIRKQKEYLKIMNESLMASEEELRQNAEELIATNEQLKTAKEEQHKFVTLVNNSEDIIVLADFQENIIYMNHSAKKFLGITPRENIAYKTLTDYHILGDEKQASYIRQQLISTGKAHYENILTNHQTGEQIETDALTIQVVDTEQRKAICIATIQRNISERKKAEREIQQKNQELHAALEELKSTQKQLIQSEKMADLGKIAAGVAHEVNTPLGAIQSSVGSLQKSIEKIIHDFPAFYYSLSSSQQAAFQEILNELKSQPEFISTKEVRQLKRKMRMTLEEKQIARADDLAELLVDSSIYHLNPAVEKILSSPNAYEIFTFIQRFVGFYRNTETIEVAAKKASKIIFALKNFSRIETDDEKQPVSLLENIDNVLTLYQNYLKLGVEIIKNAPQDIRLNAYPDQLQQVWANLIHNALQAMKFKGTLTIGVEQNNGIAEVSISDTGEGIPDEIKPKIFDIFFTTKPAGEGTGLGLDIVKKIVEKHHGTVDFVSEVGKGTTFFVRLPLS